MSEPATATERGPDPRRPGRGLRLSPIVVILAIATVLSMVVDGMCTQIVEPPKMPPSWFKHLFWRAHRILYRLVGARVLWTPKAKRGWGAMHLTTTGRKSGQPRSVIVGYIEDDSLPVVLAMNGWDEGLPAWWLNLQTQPDAVIRLKGGPDRPVRARRAEGDERDRLWKRWAEIDDGLDAFASSREADTPVVVFEHRSVNGEGKIE